MAHFTRTTVIRTPLETVWAFHSRVSGLQALTPDWMGLRIESVTQPPDAENDVLVPGSEVHAVMQPFGIIPGGRWVSRITDRERTTNSAFFRDEMVRGPFAHWAHTHRFVRTDFGTIIHDDIAYTLPGLAPDLLAQPALAMLFAYRHRRTATLLA